MRIISILEIALCIFVIGCKQQNNNVLNVDNKEVNKTRELSKNEISFWGDSATIFISNGLHNGYKISILKNNELCLMHFERGDSISRYCAVHALPYDFWHYEDSIGVYKMDMNFPVLKVDTLGTLEYSNPEMFFMDVNFDGEEEFVIEHQGYNRKYYACFDLVKGNNKGSCPGLLESMQDEPFNNIVGTNCYVPCYTIFDRKKKEIYIYETFVNWGYSETWAKRFEGMFDFGKIKVTKRVEHYFNADGEHTVTYKLIDDTLRKVREIIK